MISNKLFTLNDFNNKTYFPESIKSFASFILAARYGDPFLSG